MKCGQAQPASSRDHSARTIVGVSLCQASQWVLNDGQLDLMGLHPACTLPACMCHAVLCCVVQVTRAVVCVEVMCLTGLASSLSEGWWRGALSHASRWQQQSFTIAAATAAASSLWLQLVLQAGKVIALEFARGKRLCGRYSSRL